MIKMTATTTKFFLLAAVTSLLFAGCGGKTVSTQDGNGEVSGIVYDESGGTVPGVSVYAAGRTTTTGPGGAYVLKDVSAVDLLVKADTEINGKIYYGQNFARIFGNERSMSVNMVLYQKGRGATVYGSVVDGFGRAVAGARVFARGIGSAKALFSMTELTDANGEYRISGIPGGYDYQIVANTLGSDSDSKIVNLGTGANRRTDLQIFNGTNPILPAPRNFSVVAYTAPTEPTKRSGSANAYDGVKEQITGRAPKVKNVTRRTSGGDTVEIDLTWDALGADSLLGYRIYRGGSSGTIAPYDFLRDPLGEIFTDLDDALTDGRTYRYQVAGVTTDYNDSGVGEGPRSSVDSVRPLDNISVFSPVTDTGTVDFDWGFVSNARSYAVLLYNQKPGPGVRTIVAPVWVSSTDYGFSGLTAGTYYYVIVGTDDNGAYTLSEIRSVSVP
jgi:hypothetical protein